ncbi:GNAT family N-acetyltransferase [Chondrinema litorale]|uniref:GNAT family N-acetyltransferase n=1 Tax=Chondrinema litorale TaxID=2994555 RepID=UPI002542AF0E|nr:GNAT family N-acetyltransferase [Chondrinema litorale]UZR95696.1 GNAT family N-acetyltransferase [Chondrinema litorale]
MDAENLKEQTPLGAPISNRILFKKYIHKMLPEYKRQSMNYETMKYITGKALNEEECLKRFDFVMEVNGRHNEFGYYAVFDKNTNTVIGLSKIVLMSKECAEIGYALLPEFWRKGYGSEITKSLINYALQFENLNELIGIINPLNEASKMLLMKNGFTYLESKSVYDQLSDYYQLKIR